MAGNKSLNIISWNCEGLHSKKQEVDKLISELDPVAFCLQDTRLTQTREQFYNFKNYTSYFKSVGSYASGVALYIKSSIHQSKVELTTTLQAVAARATMKGKTYILSSIYVPPSSNPTSSDFDQLISNFKHPYLLNGDFNAHSPYWDAAYTSPRGETLETIIDKHNLIPLNTIDKTHWNRAHNTYSLVDLSLSHPAILMDFQCEVIQDLHTSDHFPILITIANASEGRRHPRFNFRKADWASIKSECVNQITPELFDDNCEDKLQVFTDRIIQIAKKYIPQTSGISRP